MLTRPREGAIAQTAASLQYSRGGPGRATQDGWLVENWPTMPGT